MGDSRHGWGTIYYDVEIDNAWADAVQRARFLGLVFEEAELVSLLLKKSLD